LPRGRQRLEFEVPGGRGGEAENEKKDLRGIVGRAKFLHNADGFPGGGSGENSWESKALLNYWPGKERGKR